MQRSIKGVDGGGEKDGRSGDDDIKIDGLGKGMDGGDEGDGNSGDGNDNNAKIDGLGKGMDGGGERDDNGEDSDGGDDGDEDDAYFCFAEGMHQTQENGNYHLGRISCKR